MTTKILSSSHPFIPSSCHKGNVLFIILIAVGLFAALTYAVSSSFRGGSNTISEEQARISAGEILRNMQSMKQGYDYLWNQQGCSMDDISFQSANGDIGSVTFTDSGDDGDTECEIFSPLGAGIGYPPNLDQYQVSASAGTALGKFLFWFAGNEPTGTYGIDSLGTASDDHMVFLQAVNPSICQAVNKILNYDNHTTDLVDAGDVIGDAAGNVFQGRTAGCRARAAGGPYDIFYVMQEL
jgi:type II secretory pathway pseudopilin PulG